MVGGKLWYSISLAFGGIAHDRETYQSINPYQDIVKKLKSKCSSYEDELPPEDDANLQNEPQLVTVLVIVLIF